MTNPIWVVDPTGNNNPYLAIVQPTRFVDIEGAILTFPAGVTRNPIFRWSDDGINWNVASFGSPFGLYFAPACEYAQGTFFASIQSYPEFFGAGLYSPDGKTWTTVFENATNFSFSFDPVQSAWLCNGTKVQTVPMQLTSAVADDASGGPLADSSQTDVTNPNNIAKNSLPSGFTAINCDFTAPSGFQYTKTPITTAIVNGGTSLPQPWPGATWVTTLNHTNGGSEDEDNNDNLYAPVAS